MARELGIDPGFLSRILRDNANPGNKFYVSLAAFCKRYGLNFDEFMDTNNIPSNLANLGSHGTIHFECPNCGTAHDIDINI